MQLLHGLGHDVGAGVAQHREAVVAADVDALDDVAVGQLAGQVDELAVDPGDDDAPVVGEEVGGRRARRYRSLDSGDGYGQLG